ncbi:hypothetical protein GCM10009738_14860 [Kitasatospora viridis]
MGSSLGVLTDAASQPLILAPRLRRRRAGRAAAEGGAVPGVAPAVGRVVGLAVVREEVSAWGGRLSSQRVAVPEGAAPAVSPEPTGPEPTGPEPAVTEPSMPKVPKPEPPTPVLPPVVARRTPRVLARPTAPRPSLVRADAEYVGEPVAEPDQYASSAWLRMIESYRPPWADDGAADGAVAPVGFPPLLPEGGSWASEVTAPPPPRQQPTHRQETPRRASLAESRRIGLGTPIRRTAPGAADEEEPDAEGEAELEPVEPVRTDVVPVEAKVPEPRPQVGVRQAPEPEATDRAAAPVPTVPAPALPEPAAPATGPPARAPAPLRPVASPVRAHPRSRARLASVTARSVRRPAEAPLIHPRPAAQPSAQPPMVALPLPTSPVPTSPPPPPPEPLPVPAAAQAVDLGVDPPVLVGPFDAAPIGLAPQRPHPAETEAAERQLGVPSRAPVGVAGAAPTPADAPPPTSWTAPWVTPPMVPEPSTGGAQRQQVGAPPPTSRTTSRTTSWTAPWAAPPTVRGPSTGGAQRQQDGTTPRPPAPALPDSTPDPPQLPPAAPPVARDPEPTPSGERPTAPGARRPLDLDDEEQIEELAIQVYQRVHRWLRSDLLVHRERTGRLGAGGPFGWTR